MTDAAVKEQNFLDGGGIAWTHYGYATASSIISGGPTSSPVVLRGAAENRW